MEEADALNKLFEIPLCKALYTCREFSDDEDLEALEQELGKLDEQARWAAFNLAMIHIQSHYHEKFMRWRMGLSDSLEAKKVIARPELYQ